MLQRAARNAYSWWWASHIRTKQSKWLDENLQDMEEKVDYILKIIDEDGDSFAQRAEMYYRKRPELVNFVEDSFRGYRALAERYDHLSRELQNANRTIASVYPERVHLDMDDEDGENFGPAETSLDEFSKLSKSLPVAPKLSIPKVPISSRNNAKVPSRLMSKKGLLLKINANNDASSATTPCSGLSKSEALKEIDGLQKGILSLQTEKEFVKSSYDIGLAKYWEIENQVTEMQVKVSSLQDEFGIGTYIEDDEARKLMMATALKSCQDTLSRLQKKQKQSAEEARLEYQRIKGVQDKFKILKEGFISNRAHQQDTIEEQRPSSLNLESENLEKQVNGTEEENYDLELLRAKIKEELQVSSGNSLTISELAEKADELVDKVITLECEISSQNAYVKRLRSETNELQAHLQSLEEENETLIENSDIKNNKIRELEEELLRVQSLKLSIRHHNNNLQNHFTEASCNLDNLSEKLLNIKPDEEDESTTSLDEMTDAPGVKPVKQLQEAEDMTSADIIPETSKDVKAGETKKKAISAEQLTSSSVDDQKKGSEALHNNSTISRDTATEEELRRDSKTSAAGSGEGSEAHEGMIALHDITSISRGTATEKKPRRDHKARGKSAQSDMYNQFLEPSGNVQVKSIAENGSGKGFEAHKDSMASHDISTVLRNTTEEDWTTDRKATGNSEQPNLQNQFDGVSGTAQGKDVSAIGLGKGSAAHEGIPARRDILSFSRDMKKEEELRSSHKNYGNSNSEHSDLRNQFDDVSRNVQVKDVEATGPGNQSDAHEGIRAGHGISSIINDMAREEEIRRDRKASGISGQSDLYNLLNDVCGNFRVKGTAAADGGKRSEAHEGITAPHDISTISRDMATEKERSRNGKATGNLGQSDLYNQLNDASGNVRVKDSAERDEGKRADAHVSIMALHNISTLSSDTTTEELRREGEINRNSGQSVSYNPFDDFSANVQEKDLAATGGGKGSEALEGIMVLHDISTLSRDTATEELRSEGKINGNSGQSERYNPFDDCSGIVQEKVETETGGGKGSGAHEGILALHNISTISQDTVTAEELRREGKISGNSEQSERYNTFDDVAGNIKENDVAGTATISRSTEIDEELRSDSTLGQGKFHEAKKQDLFQIVYGDPYLKQAEFDIEEDDQPNWKELFLNGLDDREKVLLQEYTSILRNYKEVKKKLNEVEMKKRASLFQYAIQMKLLRSANAVKDSEIQSLQKKLNCPQMDQGQTPDSNESLITASFHVSDVHFLDSDQKAIPNRSEKPTFGSMDMMEESTAPEQAKISYVEDDERDIDIINVDESHTFSTIEDKIRMDIDELLEENIEFWLRFSTSFHQIQKFQNSVQDLQAELVKLKDNKKQDGNTKSGSLLSEIRPIYRHLREIQTELTLWLEHNAVLKDDLQNRLSSLSSLQEEIMRLSNAGSKMEDSELSDYQAAKFQGEILNMKQENNKVADELQAGLERVKNLQVEIQRTLASLDEELGISSKNQQTKNRPRIPLRSFLFGVKLKRQRPSIFACVTPTLQKQYSDITAVPR